MAKRNAILSATRELLLQRGPAVTLDEVAEAAGVSRQTIYNSWSCKEQLLAAVIEGGVDEMMQSLVTAGDEASVEETLTRLARAYLDRILSPVALGLMRLVMCSHGHFGPAWYAAGADRARRLLSEYLRRQDARGVLVVEDPDLAAEHFMGMLKGNYYLKVMLHGPGAIEPEAHERRIRAGVATFLRAYGRGR